MQSTPEKLEKINHELQSCQPGLENSGRNLTKEVDGRANFDNCKPLKGEEKGFKGITQREGVFGMPCFDVILVLPFFNDFTVLLSRNDPMP